MSIKISDQQKSLRQLEKWAAKWLSGEEFEIFRGKVQELHRKAGEGLDIDRERVDLVKQVERAASKVKLNTTQNP